MSANAEEAQQKKVTSDRVQNALMEKDDIMRDGVQYEEMYANQNGGSRRNNNN
jgi:hypothetical protein